jgi:hypothetical protein
MPVTVCVPRPCGYLTGLRDVSRKLRQFRIAAISVLTRLAIHKQIDETDNREKNPPAASTRVVHSPKYEGITGDQERKTIGNTRQDSNVTASCYDLSVNPISQLDPGYNQSYDPRQQSEAETGETVQEYERPVFPSPRPSAKRCILFQHSKIPLRTLTLSL